GVARRFDECRVLLEVGKAKQRQAALALAEEFARAAKLQVVASDLEAVVALVDHLEALASRRRELGAEEQDADAVARAPADTAPELVQLGKAEALRALNHHQGRVRH